VLAELLEKKDEIQQLEELLKANADTIMDLSSQIEEVNGNANKAYEEL
jgi:hypothetical protein